MEKKPKNAGELRKTGYRILSVKEEMRKNLIDNIQKGERLFPPIIGYDETVIPAIENAILSGHDMIFLGERGQAKSRIMRHLIDLLDEEIPALAGCEINDNPFHPICKRCKELLKKDGDKAAVTWIPREKRYAEKLATPDVTIADLIGEIDPIKVAEGRYLSDELAIHFGLIPRTNRGIFSINELPDLSEKIQVGLFNLMEERDIQIRGFKIQLPLDVYIVASANPEDYTNRGRIITPLKDRYGSQIRTHYPLSLRDEVSIIEQERHTFEDNGYMTMVPQFMQEIVAEVTLYARKNPEINQRSGVSVRMSINNYENLISNALKRAIRLEEKEVIPRISDLYSIIPSSIGKIETIGIEEKHEDPLIIEMVKKAVLTVFNRFYAPETFDTFLKKFSDGQNIEVSEATPSHEYLKKISEFGGLNKVISQSQPNASPSLSASLLEFILEGLYLNRKLSKEEVGDTTLYHK